MMPVLSSSSHQLEPCVHSREASLSVVVLKPWRRAAASSSSDDQLSQGRETPDLHHLEPKRITYNHQIRITCFTHEVDRYDPFRVYLLHTGNTGTTPLGFICFKPEVHRYDPFGVSLLHTGGTQVGPLWDLSASNRKYTGTIPLGFLCFTQEVHRYDPFGIYLLQTGSTQVRSLWGFFASHRRYTGTTPSGCYNVSYHVPLQIIETVLPFTLLGGGVKRGTSV